MDGVVIAAGEGRRLRPLTERWPKALLPVDGRPVIGLLLRELATLGLDAIWLVVGHLGEQIERFCGDGAAFGVRVQLVRQPQLDGSADAVRCALAAGASPPLLVTAADTVYSPHDLRAAAGRFSACGGAGGLGVRPVPLRELPERSLVRVEHGRVLEVVEKPVAAQQGSALAGVPLWFLGDRIAASLGELPGPPYELSVALQRAIDRGQTVVALELGRTRDLTRPEDVVWHNFPYLWTEGT